MTERLRTEIERTLPDRPFAIEWWDGTSTPATRGGGPVFRVRSPRALGHALRAPGQLGIGRAYVAGDLDPDDLDRVIDLLATWEPPALDGAAKRRLLAAAVRTYGLRPPPRAPAAELRPRGRRHSVARDARAVRHHYDVSNDFFALFLDASMTYSCAIFSRGAETLEDAQEAKLELVCTKLALREGERLLDVGCGWGSFAIHAATRHGARVTGITLSPPQAEEARRRAADAGVADRVEIKVMDWRELRGGAVRRHRLDRDGRARRRGADRRLRRAAGVAARPRRAAAQPRHRAAAPRRGGGGAVLGAVRVPGRGAPPPFPGAGRARGAPVSSPTRSRASSATTSGR